ncbi:hypothetical protein IH781_02645 [Patescibacteria group bacterium]|nr:hypothetical protein [Patescibacteria group bacterium]
MTPNRAHDCLSHLGLARELAALLQLTVAEPTSPNLPQPTADVAGWTVAITDPQLCSRYLGVVLEQLQVRPSPLAIQAKLLAAGGKPINNLVDITNYVMFEYGNPTHLFDQALMPGQDITVRLASNEEKLTTLDEVEQDLTSADLVITAAGKPVALAGIMGGATSGIGDTTKNVWLETANFSPWHVQETAARLAMRSESSTRFSKGLHPRLVELAASRATSLLQEQAGAKVIGVIDAYPEPRPNHTIQFRPQRVADIGGLKITPRQSQETLERLRCEVATTTKPWKVSVPFDRLDLVAEHDLVEEVLRVLA